MPWAEAMAERIPEKEPGPTPTRICEGAGGLGRRVCREGTRVAATVPGRVPEAMAWPCWVNAQEAGEDEASRMRRVIKKARAGRVERGRKY
jgi:hypothetical protein